MKVAILSESSADEAALRLLVNALIGRESQPIDRPLRGRGWASVFQVLPVALRHLHYQTDADAFVLTVDADASPIHEAAHDAPDGADTRCRLCRLRSEVERAQNVLRPVPGRQPVQIALGLAVPCIEAWYLCGRDPGVNEAAWINGVRAKKRPYDCRALKRRVYSTDRPSLEIETAHAEEDARRLATNLTVLEDEFPNGFGPLARAIRSWQIPPASGS
jgi:hypothetical protein